MLSFLCLLQTRSRDRQDNVERRRQRGKSESGQEEKSTEKKKLRKQSVKTPVLLCVGSPGSSSEKKKRPQPVCE